MSKEENINLIVFKLLLPPPSYFNPINVIEMGGAGLVGVQKPHQL